MTDTWVREQVEIIRNATRDASRSRESAIRFLEEAGIIKKETGHKKNPKPHSKTKK
jgi:hypothetical protein